MVSVIIPAYNAEKYIYRAVTSVQKQTYSFIEIIIVNDGSVDNTLKICKNLSRDDKRIKVFTKENGGLSSARNYGIERAKGDYLAFLDADDEFECSFLEKMTQSMVEKGADMAVCGYNSVFDDGSVLASDIFESDIALKKEVAIKELILRKRFSSHAWNKVYKRKLFENIRYPEGKNYEDIFVMPQIVEKCSLITFLAERLVKYYQINNSISRSFTLKNEFDAFEATYLRYTRYKGNYDEVYEFLVKEPIEIAERIYVVKKSEDEKKLYLLRNKNLEAFLCKQRKIKKAYKALDMKYKILLFCYPLFKGTVRYKRKI